MVDIVAGFEERALVFMVGLYADVALTAEEVAATISVQNLGVKPPTMQNAVS